MTAILGISAFYHDSAAALVVDGRIVAAAQEERFTRIKHDPAFPTHAIDYCLREAGLSAGRSRLRRVLRQAADQVRTAARDLPGLCSRRGSAAFAWPCRSGSRTSCTCGGRLRSGLGRPEPCPADLHRPSREPRRQRVLPQPVRRGGDRDSGRRRRVEHGHLRRRRGKPHPPDRPHLVSPLAGPACIRPSPTTAASRSTAASTS